MDSICILCELESLEYRSIGAHAHSARAKVMGHSFLQFYESCYKGMLVLYSLNTDAIALSGRLSITMY